MNRQLTLEDSLPSDAERAVMLGRVWLPGPQGGPTLALLRHGELHDVSELAPTVSALLERDDALAALKQAPPRPLGALAEWLADTVRYGPDPLHRHLLAPNDLQVVKAAGVTFADSMVERVIEEQTRGDASRAAAVRSQVVALVGDDLARIRPGSAEAEKLKSLLIEQKLWSQYLEVGIGPYAEIFTKAAPMASLGSGVEIGLHPDSSWNNPEPEVVLVVSPRGQVVGAALGNDVNLRDFEGRSALLLGKAKDNNGSCAIGPFIRLFDAHFGIDEVRCAVVNLNVTGEDDFVLEGSSSMSRISRDPLELVRHAMGPHHQYPDGAMLFCGTMFAPIKDRDAKGSGFTHHLGDRVAISAERLGGLVNWVNLSDRIPPWQFGAGALMRNLAGRGLLG